MYDDYRKISAVGRALGVFLMLSMQRPDAKVLDGKLKLNMTVRMGFRCADSINSNIMGTITAEDLGAIWSDDSKITWARAQSDLI